ncbi:MAG: DUF362 domain-containing protein [Oscillospiraceae bacterium]|nr:DUF362 domain-containing protein [Oscillospiraceae bacterium]
MSKILFASVEFNKYEWGQTLPQKFSRLVEKMGLQDVVKDKLVAIKMHVGRGIGFTTIHPMFVKTLIDKVKEYGGKPFVTDQTVDGAESRGYTAEALGAPIVDVCGVTGKYYYPLDVDFKSFKNADIAGHIKDADVLIDLSHVKGHGACGYGGACKNLAMGAVTDRTRQQIHGLEGEIIWNSETCTRCKKCVESCNHYANSFDKDGNYQVFMHHCTNCQHCVKVCPNGSIFIDDKNYADGYKDFQKGMALCTQKVLESFEPGHVFYINFLMNITAVCDCWGISTPSLVPDIGVMASTDMVAIERASIDAIKIENLLTNGVPGGGDLSGGTGHLFERLHGKNPYLQLDELERLGLGSQEYTFVEVK